MIRNNFYNKIKSLIANITQLPVNILINMLINSSNYFSNIQFINIFQLALMFVTNYNQSNVIHSALPYGVILILKIAFAKLYALVWSCK